MGALPINIAGELNPQSNGTRTLVLVGRTGNGKSAVANSILGKRAFKSVARASGVTQSCQMQQTQLKDGHVANVIDTPGLFDISAGSAFISKEIVKCFNLAKDGIHAFLLVLTVRNRFSEEEESAVQSIKELFGSKIIDHMIVVFTGGDVLENDDLTLDDYLEDCPKPLQEILTLTKNRTVLFNNITKDERKRAEQVQKLMSLVNMVVVQNGGKPYTNELSYELKRVASKKQMQAEYDAKLKKITVEMEGKINALTNRLEQQLAVEQAARRRAEEEALSTHRRSADEIAKLRESLERAQQQIRAPPRRGGGCTVM